MQAPTVRHSGNDWASRNNLRNAAVSASSIMNTRQWGDAGAENNPAMLEYRAALANNNALQLTQPGMDLEGMRQIGQLARERLSQAGQNDRAELGALRFDQANQVDRARLAVEQTTAGFQNRSAQRLENAQVALENAKTPEAQRSAYLRLMALAGKQEHAKDRYITVGGGQTVRDGQTVKEPTSVLDTATQQWMQPPGQGGPVTVQSREQLAALPSGSVYVGPNDKQYRKD